MTKYLSGDQIKKNSMGSVCCTCGGAGDKRAILCFSGKSLVKETLGRPRRRWKGSIKMDL
jgi:hypothetical protein